MIPSNLPPGCTDADIERTVQDAEFCDYCGQATFNQECAFCQSQENKADAEREDDL